MASIASSPFSNRSTSSPEAAPGPSERNGYRAGPSTGLHSVVAAMNPSYQSFSNHRLHNQDDVKSHIPPVAAPSIPHPTASASRSDPPKRLMVVDGLHVATPSIEDITNGSNRNKLLLQGDPQVIQKQRVETAIRVIIDLLRYIPPSPSNPVDPSLSVLLPRNANGFAASFERIATFRGLRLQAGTTTKASSKKQLSAGVIPKEQLAYVETAVYMSGENGKRVYACKRCRQREARRRQSKDASRKKHSNSESDTSSSNPKPRLSLVPPSSEYITSENPDQYDPPKSAQVVEEPSWDPSRPDWRHEIVLFNSPPEVPIKDGSCVWLPFRVVCYGKCHGEKVGFRIKFTLRTSTGQIIATETTPPIRITDDHKTDKVKPKVEPLSTTQTVARNRKGRISAASSRRQSPAPSEDEQSVHSFSGAGAILQKQTPQVRVKPYERPIPSPATSLNQLPMDFTTIPDRPVFHRQHSASSTHSISHSIQSTQDMVDRWSRSSSIENGDERQNGTVSPGALRRPLFRNLTPLDGSVASVAPSPMIGQNANGVQDDLYLSDPSQSPIALMSALGFNSTDMQNQVPMLFNNDRLDVEMNSETIDQGLDSLFSGSASHTSASSYNDSVSAFSNGFGASLYSDSGLVPDGMEGFLDFSGGHDTGLTNPFQTISPPAPAPFDFTDFLNSDQFQAPAQQDTSFQDLLATISAPLQLPPVITHVIPGEGTMAGGIQIAIAGRLFAPGSVVLFGQRPAVTKVVSEGFVECVLPPSSFAGDVEVTIQGTPSQSTTGQAMTFKYTNTDKEIMRLALEVRDQYQNSSSDAAYRLAQHVARSQTNSEWSDRSSLSPPVNNPSPTDSDTVPDGKDGLQTTLITFLAALDENAPGSLRRSGAVNHRNKASQTLLHIATVMGFHRLVRRLVVVGAHLDLQDENGFTPLSFAALCGQTACARVLLDAGASYDGPTVFGEMPLDLAKAGEHAEVETLLLSAVWSTATEDAVEAEVGSVKEIETTSEIDDDNPSDSGSESEISSMIRPKKRTRVKGKKKEVTTDEVGITPQTTTSSLSDPSDDPPPYAPADSPHEDDSQTSWMSRTLSNSLPEAVWGRLPLPSLFIPEKWQHTAQTAIDDRPGHGWIALPAPSWETLSKMTSPEEVRLFTQAMAAAAFNAVVQSGATLTNTGPTTHHARHLDVSRVGSQSAIEEVDGVTPGRKMSKSGERRRRRSTGTSSGGDVSTEQRKKSLKQDRMLYMFWLPVLLFVGFWLMVTAVPIATGFSLIYARQITRAIKQRM